ncbi:MAG: O-methyltransferase [Blautia sp.]|nr:O-methyltransferase [Blautia sp.]
MILEERMQVYLDSLDTGNTLFLENMEKEARMEGVPVIRKSTQRFIKTLLAEKKPRRVLEVGTAIGFSTLLICEYGPAELSVVTIENYEKRIPLARENFRRAGREEQITLLCGDAEKILPSLEGEFDLIFMDAAKGQYIHWLPQIKRLLPEGGVLLSDNVLQEGDILESHFLVERRNRTIYKRMREYLFAITHDPELSTTVLPIGDGLSYTVRL